MADFFIMKLSLKSLSLHAESSDRNNLQFEY